MSNQNADVIREFRADGGRITGRYGAPLLLLTTVGRRSGAPRVNPLVYTTDGDRYVVFATNGGRDRDPEWLRNLLTAGHATIEVGTTALEVDAHVASGDERKRLWTNQVAVNPGFAEYERSTDRMIPVVILVRRSSGALLTNGVLGDRARD